MSVDQGSRKGYHGFIEYDHDGTQVTKVCSRSNTPGVSSLKREYATLQSIKDLDIAPRARRYFVQTDGTESITMERVNGKHWFELTVEEQRQYLPAVISTLTLLHNAKSSRWRYEVNGTWETGTTYDAYRSNIQLLRKFALSCGYTEAIRFLQLYGNELFSIIRSVPPDEDFALIHFDPSPGNIFITSDGIKLIDWGSAHYNDRALDIARVITKLTDGSKEATESVLGWCTEDRSFRRRILAYLPLAYLAIAVGRAENNGRSIPVGAALRGLSQREVYLKAQELIIHIIKGQIE